MSVNTEPAEKFQALIAGLAGLSALVGTRIGQDRPMDQGGFPAITWSAEEDRPGTTDAENWLTRDFRITVDVFGSNLDTLDEIRAILDGDGSTGLNEANNRSGRPLDTTNWKCTRLRRVSAWRRLDWSGRQDVTMNDLWQLQGEWRYTMQRKQA